MSTRRQLLVWASVIIALSLILISKVRDTSAIAQTIDTTDQVDLATILGNDTNFRSKFELDSSTNNDTLEVSNSPTPPIPQYVESEVRLHKTFDVKNIPEGNRKEDIKPAKSVIESTTESPANQPSISPKIYHIKKNDSLWKIADRNNLDIYTLLTFNKLKNANLIKKGQKIRIPSTRGILHTVVKNETLEDIAIRYQVGLSVIISANSIQDPDFIQANTDLFLPGAKLTNRQVRERLKRRLTGKAVNPRFILPVKGRMSDGYGYRIHPVLKRRRLHKGLDIAAKTGTNVRASASGRVAFSGVMGGYGNLVILEHVGGYETRYAHNARLLVREGQHVRQGQKIAQVGSTGLSTGPHLHFEIRKNQKVLNPIDHLER